MKKIFLILSVLIIIVVTGCSNSSSNLEKINLENLYSKLENKETFIVYFAKDDNTVLEKKLNTILENNNLTGYLVNVNKISDEEKIKLQPTITYEDNSIVFIIDGKDPSKLSHVTSDDVTNNELIARLKDMKFIKEEKK